MTFYPPTATLAAGAIVHVAAAQGIDPSAGLPAYRVSKAEVMTHAVAPDAITGGRTADAAS